ncbi:MAG: 1-(5-phosphoribosyl)-5-[(5-phosphoribosylamino)methylideneamino] imidazole-4-carboxamide isomerase [Archangiaceae bacterium]|nr:1-(5-phosphoribosyl)-5-[(5-phosphoribosylamino)methylideneamino] imidazole-4-carboxamide isomerase [Archangiaceae bacterium]
MRPLPAIDLREGACVQLVGGRTDAEKIRLPDPLEVSRRFFAAGLKHQHVVDLDAALGLGSNAKVIEKLARQPGVELQVGGGVRDEQRIEALLTLGVTRVIVGTRAVQEPEWLERCAAQYPSRLVLAADVRGRQVVAKGWTEATALNIDQLLDRVKGLPLAGVLITAVHVEGQLQGVDLPLFQDAVKRSAQPIIASGGVTTVDDLRALAREGVAAAVIGMAIYTGRIKLEDLAEEIA